MDPIEAGRAPWVDAIARQVRTEGRNLVLDRAVALVACHEQPWLQLGDLLASLDELAAGLHVPDHADVFEAVARLRIHLFGPGGFRGDDEDYYDPRNSYLDQVLQRRKGLPILLSVVTMAVGVRSGVPLAGVPFPGHFVVTPLGADPAFYLDPFAGGAVRRRDEMHARLANVLDRPLARISRPDRFLQPCAPLDIVRRVNSNLKQAFLRKNDAAGALRAVERLLLLSPDDSEEQRDRALLLARLERFEEAIERLEAWLGANPGAEDGAEMAQLLAQLKNDAAAR